MTYEPLVPAHVDLRDFPFMPVDVRRLLTSETWLTASGDEKAAAMTLWLESWHQVPAGSLPDNDRMLTILSQAGGKWKKVKAAALRGWKKCRDGRLYHPVVCEKAMEAWERKQAQRLRTEKARRARYNRNVTDAPTDNVTSSVTENVTGSKGQGQGQGQGQGSKSPERNPTPSSAPDVALGNRLLEIVGIDPARWTGTFGPVQAWLNAGYDPETVIVPTIRDVMRRQRASKGEAWRPNSLQFFHRAVEETASRLAPTPAEMPKPRIDPHVRKWPPERWYRAYRTQDEFGGVWPDEYGPPPGAEGHLGPGRPDTDARAGEKSPKPNSCVPTTT